MRELRRSLADPVSEALLSSMWRDISALRRHRRQRALRFWRAAAVGASVFALAAFGVVGWRVLRPNPPGPLHLADGSLPSVLAYVHRRAQTPFLFEDGSTVVLGESTEVQVLGNDGRTFTSRLASGHARFHVEPEGPRHWTVECGLAAVEVVGTELVITRAASWLRVEVEHGVVLVRGEHVPDGVQRLTAGESIVVRAPPPVPPIATVVALSIQPDRAAEVAAVAGRRDDRTQPRWRDLARRGEFTEAYATLGPDGLAFEAENASVEDLLGLADVARLSGHPEQAVAPLERIVRNHSTDRAAGLAAFTLGRIEVDQLGRPLDAVQSFERAIALGVPHELVGDAVGRLAEAQARAGDCVSSRATVAANAQRFPAGNRVATLSALCESP